MQPYQHLHLTERFATDLLEGGFSTEEYADVLEALRLLDTDAESARAAYRAHFLPELGCWALNVTANVRLTFSPVEEEFLLLTISRLP